MKLLLVKGSKVGDSSCQQLASRYLERLGKFLPLEVVELRTSDQPLSAKELQKIFDRSGKQGRIHTILLDEQGDCWHSRGFAKKLQIMVDDPAIATLCFVVGSPFGFSSEAKKLANSTWRLSDLTMQGDLAWAVLSEQLYRAMTIMRNIPYHH